MDALSDILNILKLRGNIYFRTLFHAPWAVEVPRFKNAARFHFTLHGGCHVQVENVSDSFQLEESELIIVPHGRSHVLADSPDTPAIHLGKAIDLSGYQGDGILDYGNNRTGSITALICGYFDFSNIAAHPLISQLPAALVIRKSQLAEHAWLRDTLKLLAHESGKVRAGSNALIRRLTEIIFLLALRVWNETGYAGYTFLSALSDAKLGNSIVAMHKNPAQRWNLTSLASTSGLSRTTYADRFKKFIKLTPIEYITQWRLQLAIRALLDTNQPIEVIADDVGYRSTAAFTRVFKKIIGVNPGNFRRQYKPHQSAKHKKLQSSRQNKNAVIIKKTEKRKGKERTLNELTAEMA